MTNPSPLRSVLLAVDGSDHSLAAVKLLRDLPLVDPNQPDCIVTVLGVLLPRESSNQATHRLPLESAKELLSQKGFAVQTELITGYPAQVIAQYAAEHKPGLVIVGAKGLRATLGILLGGTAQQVVEYACCPTLVVRAPYTGLRRVMLVTDGSPHSQNALDYFETLPLPDTTEAIVTHVMPPTPLLDPIILARTWPIEHQIIQPLPPEAEEELKEIQEQDKQKGQAILEEAIQQLQSVHINAQSSLLQGDAATEIIDFAQARQVDLIVAGSRGLGQVQGWWLGSVSRKLVHYAGCSVLIIKCDSDQERSSP